MVQLASLLPQLLIHPDARSLKAGDCIIRLPLLLEPIPGRRKVIVQLPLASHVRHMDTYNQLIKRIFLVRP